MLGHSFRRQHPVGPYVVDFYCARLGLAIELDGGQHNELVVQVRDRRRDVWLANQGIKTTRFWNSDITENLDGVLETLRSVIERRAAVTPSRRWRADLPLSGGGEGRFRRGGTE